VKRALLSLVAFCLVVGCVAPRATPSATPSVADTPTPAPIANPPSVPPDEVPLFDTHIHYSADARGQFPIDRILAILNEAGVRRALVSSTPDEGTIALYERAPDLVVPILRPYRGPGETGSWTRDGTVLAYLESRYRPGIHRGIGEFHLQAGEANLPVVRQVVAMAVREDLLLHAHADARAVEELLRIDPRARVLWAHAGMAESPATIGALLERYPRLWVELALRSDVAPGGKLDPDWRALFLRHPDRFMYGTDTWIPERWNAVVGAADAARTWLRELPVEVARAIGWSNAERLLEPR
jgi:predicted TIM-barrel fold metal-dependent hydrolase